MKLFRRALAFLMAAALLTTPAWAIDLDPGTGSGFYVRDTANVLSSETEALLADYNASLERQCDGAQLVVVTVSYLNEDSDLAATELMSDWGVGSADQSNGMLLLLVANEYRGWLSTGDGLRRVFDDDTAEQYLDRYFWDYIDRDQFDEGVQTLCGALYEWYLDYYNVSGSAVRQPAGQSAGGAVAGVSIALAVIVIILALLFVGAVGRFTRMRSWGYTGGFFPVFWFGGRRRYRDWYRRQAPPPPPPPPGPGGFNGFYGGASRPRYTTRMPGPGGPAGFGGPGGFMGGGVGNSRGRGLGGRSSGGGAGRSSSFRSGGGGFRGSGGGGHSSGGGAGRR